MAELAKALAAEHDDLSLSPGAHVVEGENRLTLVVPIFKER